LAITYAAFEVNINSLADRYFRPKESALTFLNAAVPSVLICLLAVATVLKMAEQSFSPFLYFQF
jgi:alginate O-acetyltransferase complex protein AlgI